MYKEVSLMEAFKARHSGRKGFVIFQATGNISTLEEIFPMLDECLFIADLPDDKPEPETAVVVPEAETPESGPVHRKRGKPTEAEKKNIEQRILAAWNRGERNVGDVVRITGYDYRTVVKYIPDEGERP